MGALLRRQFDIITSGDTRECVLGGNATWCAKHEIEIFLTIMYEVPHFVIDTEANRSGCNVSPQKRRRREKIKDHTPTRDLRMMIAP